MNIPKRVSRYIVIYDIFSDGRLGWTSSSERRRAKIARFLLEFGVRTQKSVFEIEISRYEVEKLIFRLKKVMKLERDKIYIYPIENKILKKIYRIGKETNVFGNIYV